MCYWPSVRSRRLDIDQVLVCAFTDQIKTIITTQKRTRRPISSHLDRTSWDNKGFISWPKRYRFLAGPRRKMSKGKMGTSFRLSRVANQYTGFASYCRLADSAMLIILKIAWVPCCWGCIVCLFLSKHLQIFICVINFSTRSIKRCRKASKVFHVLTPPGNFINLSLTVPKSLRNGKQAIFRNRVMLIVT